MRCEMVEMTGRSLFSVDGLRSTPAEGPVADFEAKARAAGQEWGGKPDALVELLCQAAAGDPRLAALMRAGGGLLHTPRYLIAVARLAEPGRQVAALRAVAGEDALLTHRDGDVVLFIPAAGPGSGERSVTRLAQCLGGKGWLATAERDRARLVDGLDEACSVLRLVVAGLRPSGAYTISDVLVEYAVTLNEKVRTDLAAMIRPLRAHKVLWETLTAFVDSDYSKNKTARSLFIHRSTLDYRLKRIEDVTGCDPTSGRGAQTLTAAMIAEALQN